MPIRLATVRDPQSAEHLKSLALREQDPARALPLWRQASRLQPGDPTLLSHEAAALLALGKGTAVVDLLAAVLPRHPRHVHLVNLMGVALHQAGWFPEAARLFRHCLALDDAHPTARGNLESAEAARGRGKPAPPAVRRAVDAVLAEAARRPRQRLAVCMIAKDEAEFIAGAIESVVGLADEIIVVDTGSTDGTPEIARAAGARVEHFPWTGDFSEARNVSLDHATADWILVLDADERLTRDSWTAVRAIMEEHAGSMRVVCPRIRNLTREGRFMSDGFSGRMFPNRPELRYSGRVHEEVGRGLATVSTDFRLDVVFDHYGADPEVMREKSKDERNVALLEARLAEAPDDLMTWFYLASQHWMARRRGAAREAFARVVALFERNPSEYGLTVQQVPVPYSYVGMVRTLVEEGRASEALDYGRRGLARFPDNIDLWYHLAFAHIAVDDRAAARTCLERARSTDRAGYALIAMHDASIPAWRAEKILGDLDFEAGDQAAAFARYHAVFDALPPDGADLVVTCARLVELSVGLGEHAAAAKYTVAYLKLRPTEHPVALDVASALAAGAGLQAAYDLLTRLYEEVEPLRSVVDLSLAVGDIAEQAGADAEALRWYERVAELGSQDPRFWLRLAKLLLRLGQEQPAAEAARVARQLMGRA